MTPDGVIERCAGQVVWTAAGKKLVCNYAQSVDVGAGFDLRRIAGGLFGAHVGQRAHYLARLREERGGRIAAGVGGIRTREAEIEDLRLTRQINEDVAGLKVSVDYSLLM